MIKNPVYIWMYVFAIAMSGVFNIGLVAFGSRMESVVLVIIYDLIVGLTLLKGLRKELKNYLTKTHLKILVADVVLIALTDYLVLAFIAETGAAKAGVLSLLRIGAVYVLALTLLKEPFSKRIFIGTVISFIGAAMILILPALGNASSMQLSDFAVAAGYLLAGIMTVVSKPQFKYYKPTHLVGLRSFFAALLLIPVAFLHGDFATINEIQPLMLLVVVSFMLITGALPAILEFNALQKIQAEDAAGVLLLAPAIAVVGGLFFLNESFNVYSVAGAGVIVFGILISHDAHHRVYHQLKKDEEKLHRFIRVIMRKLVLIERKLISK